MPGTPELAQNGKHFAAGICSELLLPGISHVFQQLKSSPHSICSTPSSRFGPKVKRHKVHQHAQVRILAYSHMWFSLLTTERKGSKVKRFVALAFYTAVLDQKSKSQSLSFGPLTCVFEPHRYTHRERGLKQYHETRPKSKVKTSKKVDRNRCRTTRRCQNAIGEEPAARNNTF